MMELVKDRRLGVGDVEAQELEGRGRMKRVGRVVRVKSRYVVSRDFGYIRSQIHLDHWLIVQIDFRTLPEATLYKYLEYHDLLPRWEVSPWSEDLSMARESFLASREYSILIHNSARVVQVCSSDSYSRSAHR